ncbi:MAG TPA: NAD(P)/FAD-dependent oxidoreductase [Myxococcota bacterium]|nr:NAD(P)/FAD-dependent oxidoreductase [Myxococcota bacterium]
MNAQAPRPSSLPTIAILGAGISGLCLGIRLKRAGIHSFTIYEKSDCVGGTWLDNSYPGACCDVPSHLYSFSFEPNPDWSRKFSPQAEIQQYLEGCARKYGLYEHIRFGTEITGASFDEESGEWHLRTGSGEAIRARVFVAATGQLNRPHVPDLPGLGDFAGERWHSARWDHAHDLSGESVGVIGNGASAIQFIPPVQRKARKLTIFQRSANYVAARNDRAYTESEKWRYRHVPGLLKLRRWAIYGLFELNFLTFVRDTWFGRKMKERAMQYLDQVVKDPKLRATLTPDYPIGCKRILISDDLYQALIEPNVEIVTSPIERVTREGVATKDGRLHRLDTLIFATGFETTSFLAPMTIEGRGGRKLEDVWRDGAEAHLGIAVSGFPNLFLMYGPNTNLGHNSIIFMIECQAGYILRTIEQMVARGAAWVDVRKSVQDAYNARVQRDLERTAWTAGCASWYKTASGKVTNNWSGFTLDYWWRTRRPRLDDFELRARG